MASFPRVKPDLDSLQQQQQTTNAEENRQLQELLSSLQLKLSSREDKLNREIETLKDQNSLLNLQYDLEKERKMRAQREVGKLTEEIGALKDQISWLGGEKSVWNERVAKAEEREKGWVEEVKKMRDECMELKIRKLKAEAEVDIWRRKFSELEARVSRLQDDVLSLAQLAGLNVTHHFDCPTTGGRPPCENVIIHSADDYPPQSTQSGQEKASGTQMLKRKLSSCEKTSGNRNSDNPDIEDVDDNSPSGKRKMNKFHDSLCKSGGSPANHGTVTAAFSPTASNNAGKIFTPLMQDPALTKPCEGKVREGGNSASHVRRFLLNCLSDSDYSFSSSDSEDDTNSNELLPKRQKSNIKTWGSEEEMRVAIEKDDEIPLKAVCALYTQRIFLQNLLPYSSSSRGVSNIDGRRGKQLAEFLLDGNQQGKLKKSVKELHEHDPKGLVDCRQLAIVHLKQLFDMYQKKEDPLFHP